MLAGKIKEFLESQGHNVEIFTLSNLIINESLLNKDFYILKSKSIFFLLAGFFLEANNIPVIPNANISYKHRYRIEAHYLIQKAKLKAPRLYFGTKAAIMDKLNESDFPLIQKPLMGSGSKGVKLIESFDDLENKNNSYIYMEQYINGDHYLVYFINDEICVLEKPPLSHEHADMSRIKTPEDIRKTIIKWKNTHNLLFGHLDIVRETGTNRLFIVDPGSFPEFSNWKGNNSVIKICNLILNEYRKKSNIK